jgi:hypothetical protein
VIARPEEPLTAGAALALGIGVALFFVGDAEFRRVLRVGPATPRIVAAVAVLTTIPLGMLVTATLQLTALVVVIAAALAVEQVRRSHDRSHRSRDVADTVG